MEPTKKIMETDSKKTYLGNRPSYRVSVKICDFIKSAVYNTFGRKFDKNTLQGLKMEKIRAKLQVSDRIRDFNFILNKMNELDALKDMLLNEHQALCLSYLKKPNDVEMEEQLHKFSFLLNSEDENKTMIEEYFVKLFMDDVLKENYDQFLFRRLDDKIKKKIISRLAINNKNIL